MKTKHLILICIFSYRFTQLNAQCLDANWQIIGPTGAVIGAPDNGIGRLQAAAVDPTDINFVFTGSETGGLWKWDEDLGINTLMGTDQLDKIGVAAIAINPDNPDEILISTGRNNSPSYSTGYNSSGIYKTTNSGGEWTKVLDWKDILNPDYPEEARENWNQIQIRKIVYNPENLDEVLAIVRMTMDLEGGALFNAGKLYKSNDAGSTWADITSASLDDRYFVDMEVLSDNATSTSTVYISSHKLYKSTDFGTTWTNETQVTLQNIMLLNNLIIQIGDITGKVVRNYTFENNNWVTAGNKIRFSFQRNNLKQGIYLLNVYSDGILLGSEKISLL